MATKAGRLDQKSLEDALETAFNDQQEDGLEKTRAAGVDPSFMAQLQDKLAGQDGEAMVAEAEGGLKAPACTRMLTAKELAELEAEDEEEAKVTVQATSQGEFLDKVDSKLVTELNKKLSDEAAQGQKKIFPGFDDIDTNNDGVIDRKEFEAALQGSRQQATGSSGPDGNLQADLSAALLKHADTFTKEEAMDPALMVAQSRGFIQNVDTNLVAELQRKLGGEGIGRIESPDRYPDNTKTLDKNMLPADGNIDGIDARLVTELQQKLSNVEDGGEMQNGCRAPQPTMKLNKEMLDGLNDEPYGEEKDSGAGLRAPQPTALITADMLAALEDEDDIDIAPDPVASAAATGQTNSFDPNFANSLQQKLQSEGVGLPSVAMGKVSDEKSSGLKAPATTQKLSVDQLANLGDEDEDVPLIDNQMNGMRLPQTADALPAAMPAGMPAGLPIGNLSEMTSSAGPNAEQLATLTAAAAALQEVAPYMPAAGSFPALSALTVRDMGNIGKVMASVRDMPETTDMWGQPRPLTSSCKLRLAWLSKDEVRKENEQLRKEISSLRAEIEMHRKEATFAMKS